jgi:hypothetical protein
MNKLDKSDVDLEIFVDRHIFRMNDDRLFKRLIEMYEKPKPQVIPYIMSKFNKKKCPCCNGVGYQPL